MHSLCLIRFGTLINVMLKNHVLHVITILTLVRKINPGNSTKIQTTCGDPCFNGIDMTAFIWIRYQAEMYIRSFSTGLAQDVSVCALM